MSDGRGQDDLALGPHRDRRPPRCRPTRCITAARPGAPACRERRPWPALGSAVTAAFVRRLPPVPAGLGAASSVALPPPKSGKRRRRAKRFSRFRRVKREHHHVRGARERPGHPPGGVGRRGAGAGRRRDFGAHPKLAAHCASTAGNAASAAIPVPAAGESPILGGAGPPASFPAVDRVVVSARFADLPGWRHALAAGDFDPPGLAAPRPLGVPLSVAQLFAPAGAWRARRYRGYAIGFDAAACFDPRRPTPPGPAPRLLGDRRLHGGAPMRVFVAPPDADPGRWRAPDPGRRARARCRPRLPSSPG